MARTVSGREVLAQAKASAAKAKTVKELRPAQAVLLPLEFDLTLKQTAEIIGVATRPYAVEVFAPNGQVETALKHQIRLTSSIGATCRTVKAVTPSPWW